MNAIDSQKTVRLKVQGAEPSDAGRGIARLDPADMESLGVRSGDHVLLGGEASAVARVIPSFKHQRGDKCIRLDGLLRQSAGVKIDDSIQVTRTEIVSAEVVTLEPLDAIPAERDYEYIKALLQDYPVIRGGRIRATLFGSETLDFEVTTLMPDRPAKIDGSTKIVFARISKSAGDSKRFSYEDIGGIRTQIKRIREMIELPLKFPEVFESLGIDAPRGILLYGPPGCGKTLIARTIAHETSANFYPINGPEIIHKFYGESEAHLRQIFEEAAKNGPSIIFLDEIDAIAPHRENAAGDVERRVVAQLLTLMDGLNQRENLVVIGATNLPNSIDPALRRPGRFDREIEIPIPDREDRFQILSIHSRGIPTTADVDLRQLANITHGFVGADLAALCREAAMSCVRRVTESIDLSQERISYSQLAELQVSASDFASAFESITPSAIREVFVEVPAVRWDDVGGHHDIKQQLIEAVVWPLKHERLFKQAAVKPEKGLILAGPPGVGKTMLAKALATESGVNFISVKGPELINKFVGESEKRVRDLFRRARQASPCIVFFDEIDGLLSSRESGSNDSGVASRVLSQFLTEMDGVEELQGVFVLGATNRADLIEPALCRFGRFSTTINLGLPNADARAEIIRVHTRNRPLANSIDLKWLVEASEGMSGAEIASVLATAALNSIRRVIAVNEEDFESNCQLQITEADIRAAFEQRMQAK